MKIISKQPKARIKINTIIDHYIRNQLKLNADQYVLIDFIYQHKNTNLDEISECLGYKKEYLEIVQQSLFEKGLLDLQYKATNKWTKYFTVSQEEFEEFWKVYHVGSKAEAKEIYMKARKIIDGETLLESAKKYIKFKDFTGQFLEHTRTWLNPKYQKWNDDYSIPEEQNVYVHPINQNQSNKIHP